MKRLMSSFSRIWVRMLTFQVPDVDEIKFHAKPSWRASNELKGSKGCRSMLQE